MAARAVGVDGCQSGWIAVELVGGTFNRAFFAASISEVLIRFPDANAFGIDIPIGLPARGPRQADLDARKFVGPRRSSVFATPAREQLEGPWGPGLRITRQAHSLGPRIFEVEKAVAVKTVSDKIYEVHPEVSFAAMSKGPVRYPKSSWNGLQFRRRLLSEAGVDLPDDLESVGVVPADDLLDAAAASWTANRIVMKSAATLPKDPPIDDAGRSIAIWY